MKELRVTYNYHSKIHHKYMRRKMTLLAGDFEAEDCLQEFDAFSHHFPPQKESNFPPQKESNFPILALLSMICTGMIFLSGDVTEKQDRNNIYCITDVEVLE